MHVHVSEIHHEVSVFPKLSRLDLCHILCSHVSHIQKLGGILVVIRSEGGTLQGGRLRSSSICSFIEEDHLAGALVQSVRGEVTSEFALLIGKLEAATAHVRSI